MMLSSSHPFFDFDHPELDDYRLIEQSQDRDLFWQKKDYESNVVYSAEFKDLFEGMVAFNPKHRLSMR